MICMFDISLQLDQKKIKKSSTTSFEYKRLQIYANMALNNSSRRHVFKWNLQIYYSSVNGPMSNIQKDEF